MLPHSPDAEKAVLGIALRDQSQLGEIVESIKDDYFFSDAHREIFSHIRSIYDSGMSVDVVSVADRMRGASADVNVTFLVELLEGAPVAENVGHYANLLKRDFFVRSAVKVSTGVINDAKRHWNSAEEFLAHAEASLFGLSKNIAGGQIHGMMSCLESALNYIEEAVRHDGKLTGVPSGFGDLDRLTGGFQKGHLILLAARPGMGKTALALNMLLNALLAGKSVLTFSLEMTRIEIMLRFLCSLARVDGQKIKNGTLSDEEMDRFMAAYQTLAPHEGRFGLDDSSRLTLSDLRTRCRRFRDAGSLDFVVVDYVQLMRPMPGVRFESNALAVASISQGLKELAKEMNIPILALAQLNRDLEKRANQRPKASDLKDSGSLEADADMVLLIYRDDVVNPNSQDAGIAEIIVGKNRHGPMPLIRLAYFSTFVTFTNLAENNRTNLVVA